MKTENAPDSLMYFYQSPEPEINLNPSDEKLREIIAGKDAEIERLKKAHALASDMDHFNHSLLEKERVKVQEKDAEIERLKTIIRESVIQEKANADRHRKESVPLMTAITEKDAEIARLKTELSTNWAKHESTVKKPLSIKEAIESINSGPGWVTAVTISRTEWERLLTAIQEIEKDAERYKKFRAHGNQGQNATFLGWSVDMSYADNSIEFDAAVDALPKVQS